MDATKRENADLHKEIQVLKMLLKQQRKTTPTPSISPPAQNILPQEEEKHQETSAETLSITFKLKNINIYNINIYII